MNSPQPSPVSPGGFPIKTLIGLFAIFDFLTFPVLTYWERHIGPATLLAELFSGLFGATIVAQFALLTIWAAVGPPRAVVRLPLTTIVGMFLVACFVGGVAAAEVAMRFAAGGAVVVTPGLPGEIAPGFLFLPLIFLSAQLPLWVLKLATGGCLVHMDTRTGQMPTVQRQFGIGHLMAATVVVALALGLASSGMRLFGAEEAMGGMYWSMLVVYCGFFSLWSLFVTLPCLWAGLGAKSPRAGVLGLLIYAGLLGLLWVAILALFSRSLPPVEAVVMILFFFGSLMFVTLGPLYVARYCGYRYQRGDRPQPTRRTGSPFAGSDETPPAEVA